MNAGCRDYHRFNRRTFLRIGGATFFGLTMPQLFRARAAAAGVKPKAKQVLLVWMYGGPSQIDMFDLKPDAKKEIARQRARGNERLRRTAAALKSSPIVEDLPTVATTPN